MTTGRCLCGAIRYEYAGEPTLVAHCHCESCRRQTSSPVTTFIIVPKAALRFTQGSQRSSPPRRAWRAASAASAVRRSTTGSRTPDAIDLYACTLDDPSNLAPQCHVHAVEQLPWFEVAGRPAPLSGVEPG